MPRVARVPTIEELSIKMNYKLTQKRMSRTIADFKALKFRFPEVRQWTDLVIKEIRNDVSPGGPRGWLDDTGALSSSMRPEIRWAQRRIGLRMLFYGVILDTGGRHLLSGPLNFVERAFLARKGVLNQIVRAKLDKIKGKS